MKNNSALSKKRGERPVGLIFQSREIDLKNIPRIDSHLHTSWTDGKDSVQGIYDEAVSKGLEFILYSEHSRKSSGEWFKQFAAEVRSLPTQPCRAYVGTEVKIETIDGEIDTTKEITDQCDFVMASAHRLLDSQGRLMHFEDTNPEEAVDSEFALTWAALSNHKVDILGHMFGMSYKRFKKDPPEHKIRELIERAALFEVAIEINSHYHPSALKMLSWCQEFGADITFGSNAHTLSKVGSAIRQLDREMRNV